MQRSVDVSVVIPVLDDAAFLARCLDALEVQTVTPREIVIVDNGSSDASVVVARERGARVVVEQERGIPAASAAGYDAAAGSIIARLDADCVPPPDWIARVDAAFGENTALAALTGSAIFTNGPVWLRRPLAVIYLASYHAAAGSALAHRPLFGSNLALRRSVWNEVRAAVHRHDSELHDDIDLSMHVGPTREIQFDPDLLMGIDIRPLTDVRALRRRVMRGFHSILSHWPGEAPPRRFVRRLLQRRHRRIEAFTPHSGGKSTPMPGEAEAS